jgi:hypothetical protein
MATPSPDYTVMLSQLSSDLHRLSDELQRSQYKQTTDIMSAQERAFNQNETRSLRSTDLIIDNVRTTSDKVYGEVQRQGESNLLATERIGGAAATQAERIYGQVGSAIDKTQNSIQMQNERLANEQLMQAERIGGASAAQAERIANQNSVQAERIANQNSVQAERIGSALSTQNERIAGALGTQNERIGHSIESLVDRNFATTLSGIADLKVSGLDQYGKIQLEAAKNKEDLAKQSAAQYSDLKDTMRTTEIDRLRDQLRKSENAELFNKHECHHGHHGHHGHGYHMSGPTPFPPFYPFGFGPYYGGGRRRSRSRSRD